MSAPKNGAVASAPARTIATPYGRLHLNTNGALDHAEMRAEQLDALLILIIGDSGSSFMGMQTKDQNALFWLMQQMAGEVREIMPMLVEAKIEVPT